jgi:hypothetical protein
VGPKYGPMSVFLCQSAGQNNNKNVASKFFESVANFKHLTMRVTNQNPFTK